jgi:hypothetical protein
MADAFEPFDIVFDLTGFASTNELPMVWLKKMFQMCPPQILAAVNVSPPDLVSGPKETLISRSSPYTTPIPTLGEEYGESQQNLYLSVAVSVNRSSPLVIRANYRLRYRSQALIFLTIPWNSPIAL